MPACDLCTRAIDATIGRRFTAVDVRTAVGRGLRPPASVTALGAAFGEPSEDLHQGWVSMVMTDASDWLLCSDCASQAQSFLGAAPAPASPAPRPEPSATAPAAPAPSQADVAAALKNLARQLEAATALPPNSGPLVEALNGLARRQRKLVERWAMTSMLLAALFGVAVGVQQNSFWIGVGACLGAFVLLAGSVEIFDRLVWNRRVVRAVLRSHEADNADGMEVYSALKAELRLFDALGRAAKALESSQLSSDFVKRLSEAIILVTLNNRLCQILLLSRDLPARRQQLEELEKVVAIGKTSWTPIVGHAQRIVQLSSQILTNRERLFAGLDLVMRR
jgi:hypothetical protein